MTNTTSPNWTPETVDGIQRVRLSNEAFIEMCLKELFRPEILPPEFVASDVTDAAVARGYQPTDWRAVGPLIMRAKTLGLIEQTGNMLPRKLPPKGHATNHYGPAYRLTIRETV